ncbi:MAG: YlxR family protein [Bacillota bacterium]
MKPRRVPLRTCIGCAETRPKREMLRIVRTLEGTLEFDPTGKRSGRGAYICPEAGCLEKAVKAKNLERAMKNPVSTIEVQDLKDNLRAAVEEVSRRQRV